MESRLNTISAASPPFFASRHPSPQWAVALKGMRVGGERKRRREGIDGEKMFLFAGDASSRNTPRHAGWAGYTLTCQVYDLTDWAGIGVGFQLSIGTGFFDDYVYSSD